MKTEKIHKGIKKQLKDRNLKRFFLEIIKPNLGKIILSVIFMSFFAGSTAYMAYLIKPIINNVFILQEINQVITLGSSLIIISLVKGFSQYIYTSILASVSIMVIANARINLFNVFLKQDLQFFHNNSPGKLMSVIINDINQINNLATNVPINIGRDLFTFIGLLAVMFIQSTIYTLMALCSIFLVIVPIQFVRKKLNKYFSQSNSGFADITSKMEQVFHGIKEVKSYHREAYEIKHFNNVAKDIAKTQKKIRKISMGLPSFMEILSGIAIGLIIMYGGYRVINHGEDAGSFFAFLAALLMAYQPIKRLTTLATTIQFGVLAINRYYFYLDTKPEINNDKNAIDISKEKSASLSFNNVSFKYPNSKEYVLKNITFKANPGQHFALVGKSGAGKSTIISLIERFYDINEGEILINDYNIKNLSIKSLRENISYIGQDLTLFDDTIYNNILYGKLDASKEEIINAAKQAFCLDFINEMPDGFDTKVGHRGVKLSGGQKQRLSIARAILKNSPILVMDEATSALDSESEDKIKQALVSLTKNKTTITIAHRFSTIVNSDNILVIDKGSIIEHGTHKELISKDTFYKKLYEFQIQKSQL